MKRECERREGQVAAVEGKGKKKTKQSEKRKEERRRKE